MRARPFRKTFEETHAGGDGSCDRHQPPRRIRHDPRCAEAHEGWWRIVMIGSAVGRACRCGPGCALPRPRREREDVHSGIIQRGSGAGASPVNNVQPGPIDTDLNPASVIGAGTAWPPQPLTAMGTLRRSPQWWPSSAGPESSYDHRSESDRRWRNDA